MRLALVCDLAVWHQIPAVIYFGIGQSHETRVGANIFVGLVKRGVMRQHRNARYYHAYY